MKDSAVSPVIGILLMLVVTIIIAAVVSGFAGGLAGGQNKAPQVSISVSPHINSIAGTDSGSGISYPSGYSEDNNYVLFEHKGGDGFSLADIKIQLQSDDTEYAVGLTDACNNSTSYSCRADPDNAVYLEEIGDSDGFIKSGDQFKLTFDANLDYGGGYAYVNLRPIDSLGGFAAPINKKTSYTIIDSKSGKAIQTGSFTLTK